MGNLFLLLTIFAETGAVICMKLSVGFQNKLYVITAVISYAASFIFLTLTLKYMSAGIANAIWAGASSLLVAVLGIFIFNEKLTLLQSLSLACIIIGLVGLSMSKQQAI